MSTKIHLVCDAQCGNEHSVEVRREFHSFSGRGYGFGTYHVPSIDEAVKPTGWIWADLIGCTYCPECWAEIMAEDDD
jgi:hypothetical protein